ncbi:MAG: YqgE/AlgH family protein [Bacteroidales bacterium]|nr:YqgE/AlgH family protein [Bacteroidales bacterium]
MDINDNIFKVNPTGVKLKTGSILISSPFLEDSLFGRSIVLITDISEDSGAIGLVLNKTTNIKLKDVAIDFPIEEMPLYAGGPVQSDFLFILHHYGDIIENSVHIVDDIYWGGDKQQIEEYIKQGLIDPKKIKFFLGYSGWAANQLKEELETESWIIADISSEINILDSLNFSKDLWKEYVLKFGSKYKKWLTFPRQAIDN